MKIALVHDWLNQIGGAEDVLEALKRSFPASPVYTSIFAETLMPAHYQDWDIRTLWIDRLPAIHIRRSNAERIRCRPGADTLPPP